MQPHHAHLPSRKATGALCRFTIPERRLALLLLLIAFLAPPLASAQSDPSLSIEIDDSGTYPVVTLENSIFKAVIRPEPRGVCGVDHVIKDLIVKTVAEDQVLYYLDANGSRGPMISATMVYDGPDRKTFRAEYADCETAPRTSAAVTEYTIFPDSPVLRIDYLSYPAFWSTILDRGRPGGASRGQYQFHGDEAYKALTGRGFVQQPKSYWNTVDGGEYADDPADGGPLNYHDHMILTVGNPDTKRGFGRILPIYRAHERGGTRILKLAERRGWLAFPRAGQRYAPAFTSYLYVWQRGQEDALGMGRSIVDGDMLIGRDPLPVELVSFEALADRSAAVLAWETASETNNAGFEVEHARFEEPFTKIGFVGGRGTTGEAQAYRYRAEDLSPGVHRFRLRQVDFDGAFAYSREVEVSVGLPEAYALGAAYPNPFNPASRFTLMVARDQSVTVEVVDVLGRRVQVLHEGLLASGVEHRFTIDGTGLPSGVYLYRATGEAFSVSRPITLLK